MNTTDSLKVFIVDDEWLIRAELCKLLSGYRQFDIVGESSNAVDAVNLINRIQPDLIFLDIQMPGLTGFDLLEMVTLNFEIIFISGFENKMKQAQQYKAVDYLFKPIKREKLISALNKVLRKKGMERIHAKATDT